MLQRKLECSLFKKPPLGPYKQPGTVKSEHFSFRRAAFPDGTRPKSAHEEMARTEARCMEGRLQPESTEVLYSGVMNHYRLACVMYHSYFCGYAQTEEDKVWPRKKSTAADSVLMISLMTCLHCDIYYESKSVGPNLGLVNLDLV